MTVHFGLPEFHCSPTFAASGHMYTCTPVYETREQRALYPAVPRNAIHCIPHAARASVTSASSSSPSPVHTIEAKNAPASSEHKAVHPVHTPAAIPAPTVSISPAAAPPARGAGPFPLLCVVLDEDDKTVDIEDCMARLYALRPDRFTMGKLSPGQKTFRADHLYEGFIEPLLVAFETNRQLFTYIIICDKPEGFDDEHIKAQTQQDRQASAGELYDFGTAVIDDRGIGFLDPERPDDEIKEWQPINQARLMHTRPLRRAEYRYFLHKMRNDPRLYGHRIVFDFAWEGPYVLASGRCIQRRDLRNAWGEADLAAYGWGIKHGTEFHVRVICKDRDLQLIGMLHRDLFRKTLLVQSSDHECVDVGSLVDGMRRCKYSVEALIIGVIMCTVDFFEKSELFAYVNDRVIVDTVHLCMDKRGLDLIGSVKDFTAMVRLVYIVADTKRCKPKTDAEIATAHARVVRCLRYWQTLDGALDLPATAKDKAA